MLTNSRISIVGDWMVCQLEWLKDQEESYLEAYAEEQISFFPDLFHRYLALWPVWRTLWPAKPRSRRLLRAERKFVYEAEDYCKSYIRGYFEDQYPHLPPGILALLEVGDWSSCQLQWLEAHQSSFLRSDFHVLWPILLEDFFRIWPDCFASSRIQNEWWVLFLLISIFWNFTCCNFIRAGSSVIGIGVAIFLLTPFRLFGLTLATTNPSGTLIDLFIDHHEFNAPVLTVHSKSSDLRKVVKKLTDFALVKIGDGYMQIPILKQTNIDGLKTYSRTSVSHGSHGEVTDTQPILSHLWFTRGYETFDQTRVIGPPSTTSGGESPQRYFLTMPKAPRKKKYKFVDVDFDPATNVMQKHARGYQQQFHRSIALNATSSQSKGYDQIVFYAPSTANTSSSPSSSHPAPSFDPPPPPSPPPPSLPAPYPPVPSPPAPSPPAPSPPAPSPPAPSPPAPSPPALSPPPFQLPSMQLYVQSPTQSPPPSPQLQTPGSHQLPDTESPPDSLSEIVAHLANLQWDLANTEMWNSNIARNRRQRFVKRKLPHSHPLRLLVIDIRAHRTSLSCLRFNQCSTSDLQIIDDMKLPLDNGLDEDCHGVIMVWHHTTPSLWARTPILANSRKPPKHESELDGGDGDEDKYEEEDEGYEEDEESEVDDYLEKEEEEVKPRDRRNPGARRRRAVNNVKVNGRELVPG
ncbi:hypothetical protein EDD22DRAFT_850106 [Suillus occidentalis]|nr:hypothetical protein EDD22DRAFT_850106 [Suillus occidentalis]